MAVRQCVPVHIDAETMAAVSDAAFFQIRTVGDGGLVKAFHLFAGLFIGNGNGNRNAGVWQGRVPAPAYNGAAFKVIERAIRAAARAVKAPPMRNIAVISKVVRVVLFFNIKSFLSFPRFVTWIALRKNEIIGSHKINICNKFVIYER